MMCEFAVRISLLLHDYCNHLKFPFPLGLNDAVADVS